MGSLRIASKRALFAVVLLAFCSAALPAARLALAPGDRAPEVRGILHDKSGYRADFAAGSATLVNFWASWCEPFKDEMPALQRLW